LRSDSVQSFGWFFVFACWFAFAAAFFLRKRPPKGTTEKRAPASLWGIALHGLAYAAVWSIPPASWQPFPPAPPVVQDTLSLAAIPLAFASAWLTLSAVRTLGKQWSLEARLTEKHRLIVAGPYSHMRHPIYTAMLGMLVATGLCKTYWLVLIVAVILYGIGTAIRIQAEEKLLRGAFGEDFDAYARYVPAIFPRLTLPRQSSPRA
jgi:protein-S-isoprenylcysteine O-methyltransferase Ste14